MSDRFRIEIQGVTEIEGLLNRLVKKGNDLLPVMRLIGTQLETSVADNFSEGHDPYGIPWPKSARAQESGGKTLIDSGTLKNTITSVARPTSIEVGSNVAYARRHNQGWSGTEQVAAHKRTMTKVFGIPLAEPRQVEVSAFSRKSSTPKRQFLGMSVHDQEDIVGIIEDYFGVEN